MLRHLMLLACHSGAALEVMNENPAELKLFADLFQAKAAKIDEHRKRMESDQYLEQATRLSRLLKGAVEALHACWLMSTRSRFLSDETLTFRFIDDAIFSAVGIGSSISNGAHNPARREMRYLLESACKHYHVDSSRQASNKPLIEKLNDLRENVPRSSIDFVEEQEYFALDDYKTKELRSDIKDMYSQTCRYVHRSREQIDEYLAVVNRGSSPGFETVGEFRAMNREFARLCDVVVYLSLSVLGPSGLAGDLFVHMLDGDANWPYHKTKYCKALSEHYSYKAERSAH
jgi:hypothetical protein